MVVSMRKLLLFNALLHIVHLSPTQANMTLLEGPGATTHSLPDKTDEYFGKHTNFVYCTKFLFELSEFDLYPNETVYVKAYNKSYTKEFYYLDGDQLEICQPESNEPTSILDDLPLQNMVAIGIGTSLICLPIHLFVFLLVSEKPSIPDYNMASLCGSLFLSYLVMIVTTVEDVHQNDVACTIAAGLMQFFLMASFLWMFIIAFDVFNSIRHATKTLRVVSTDFKVKKFLLNNLIAWGVSLLFAASAMIVNSIQGVPETFQPQFEIQCWFRQLGAHLVFFGIPVATVLCVNLFLFGFSSYKIFTNQLRTNAESQQSRTRKSHVMYIRLAIIMGVTWITFAVAALVHTLWLWYLTAALNTLQGLFIFAVFTCNDKTRKYFKKKLCW